MKRVLFVDYVETDFLLSGSGVRPAKMLNAFIERGYDVVQLIGNQMAAERPAKVKKVLEEISKNPVDFCYIESPTYPVMRHADRALIKQIHNMGIPIGYFYRDFYRKFPNLFPRRTSLSGRIKDMGLDVLQYLTDQALTYCNIVYVPSIESKRLFTYSDIRALPPAGEKHLPEGKKPNHTIIYVGGISGHYNGAFLLDVITALHNKCDDYKLILVCREEEWQEFTHPCKNAPWIEVHHTSGEGLTPLYERAAAAAAAGKSNNAYNEFAVSVKTFEYMSYGLPQVVVANKAVKEIIERERIGLAVEQSVESFAHAFESILDDEKVYQQYQENIRDSLLNRNLWVHRVDQIAADLTNCCADNYLQYKSNGE